MRNNALYVRNAVEHKKGFCGLIQKPFNNFSLG